MSETIEYNGKLYTTFHGSPFDRGMADSWYDRPKNPHWYPNGSYNSPCITNMTQNEIDDYNAGYDYNESTASKKY